MPRNQVPVYVVDAFTPVPFTGNPAGVVILGEDAESAEVPDAWMQKVASEMRHAETSFLRRRAATSSPVSWDMELRWFTPEAEVDLCGHATLAAAHVTWERWVDAPPTLVFHTRSGALTCTRASSGGIEMDFPSLPAEQAVAPEQLMPALGVRAVWVGKSKFDYLVELKSEDEVRRLRVDFNRLMEVDTRGVIVAARGTKGFDVVSRFFGPRVGVPEDPVTGSAHCVLGPYFGAKLDKTSLTCFQASPRGGIVNVRTTDDARVVLGGDATTILRGMLTGWK